MDLAKVWPLEPGVDGVLTTDYSKVKLKTGKPGFMELGAAKEAEKAGRVQLMAGIGFGDLKEPRTEAVKKPVVEAQKPEPIQEVKADMKADYRTAELKPEVKQDEEKEVEQKKDEYRTADLQPAKRPGRPPKKG